MTQVYYTYNVYAINLDSNEYNEFQDFIDNECIEQKTNNLIINFNNKNINIILINNFNELDENKIIYIFKEDTSLYNIYDTMNPYTIQYMQTNIEKDEFIDFLTYFNVDKEPFLYNYNYMTIKNE